jgi:hypothetical protein
MANQSKLKAWVRYDGTGRVISGGPIFQVNKPKVGNWKQINANLCCDGGLTTTTTTAGGGGVTPTAFIKSIYYNGSAACTTTTQGSLLFYSSSTTLDVGVAIFTDAALTTPVTEGIVIVDGMTRYVVQQNGILNTISCNSFPVSEVENNVCNGTAGNFNIAIPGNGSITDTTRIYGTFTDWGYAIGSVIYLGYSPGYLVSRPFTVVSSTVAVASGSMVPCPTSNQIFAVTNYNAYDACQGSGNTLNLFYPLNQSLGNGTTLFVNAALTIPYQPGALGTYVRIYFQAENQVCTMNGNTIQSYTSCSGITTTTTTTQAPALSFIGRGGSTSAQACGAGNNETFYTTGPFQAEIYPQTGNIIYFDQAMTQLVTYAYISLPGVGAVFQCTNGQLFNMSPCQ